MTVLLLAALLAGLSLAVVLTPIIGRGDYGQWLMTSRYYLGDEIPSYRTISALPPIVPAFIAAVRVFVSDPPMALQLVNALLLFGLGASFYLAGSILLASRLGGLLAVVAATLVTDRFMELFAFGGILQIAATLFMLLAVASFARGGQGRGHHTRWWWLGSGAMMLAALSHVGTAAIAVPMAMAVAAISSYRLRSIGWDEIKRLNTPLAGALTIAAAYWLIILLPSSREYVLNPASLAYRGPERLFSSLVSYWPTTIVMIGGAIGIAAGVWNEVGRRRVGGFVILLACALVPWGALGYSVVSGAATDYPRFATLLLVPLVIGLAGGAIRLLAIATPPVPRFWRTRLVLAAVGLLVVIISPLAVSRYARQAAVYQPRDADSLSAAVAWIDEALGESSASVLTSVRDGKWLEGTTGRAALFSQPVRYAFRRAEWQRSVDADALLRSTATLSNGYFRVMFTGRATAGRTTVPAGLLLGMNHGGEYVDLLRTLPTDGTVHGAFGSLAVSDLAPVRSVPASGAQSARITTVRSSGGEQEVSFTRRVTLWRDGTTLELRDSSPGNTLETVLKPPAGMALMGVSGDARNATICFTRVGEGEPCLQLEVTQEDATLDVIDGALRISTITSDELQILMTLMTAGPPSVELRILDPAGLVQQHQIGAALLYADDPAFESRARRLEALGFRAAMSSGPYRVMLHQRPTEELSKTR